jgi:hypothetical protein
MRQLVGDFHEAGPGGREIDADSPLHLRSFDALGGLAQMFQLGGELVRWERRFPRALALGLDDPPYMLHVVRVDADAPFDGAVLPAVSDTLWSGRASNRPVLGFTRAAIRIVGSPTSVTGLANSSAASFGTLPLLPAKPSVWRQWTIDRWLTSGSVRSVPPTASGKVCSSPGARCSRQKMQRTRLPSCCRRCSSGIVFCGGVLSRRAARALPSSLPLAGPTRAGARGHLSPRRRRNDIGELIGEGLPATG